MTKSKRGALATHYHELTKLAARTQRRLQFQCRSPRVEHQIISFAKILPAVRQELRNSGGAAGGLPKEILDRRRKFLRI